MNKEVIEEYNRMKKERDKLYVMMLNTQKGSGARMMRDDIYVKDAEAEASDWVGVEGEKPCHFGDWVYMDSRGNVHVSEKNPKRSLFSRIFNR